VSSRAVVEEDARALYVSDSTTRLVGGGGKRTLGKQGLEGAGGMGRETELGQGVWGLGGVTWLARAAGHEGGVSILLTPLTPPPPPPTPRPQPRTVPPLGGGGEGPDLCLRLFQGQLQGGTVRGQALQIAPQGVQLQLKVLLDTTQLLPLRLQAWGANAPGVGEGRRG
jgi:hypothetical protein